MNREKNLFLALSIALVGLFVLCGYSLVQCFVYNASGEDAGSHLLEIIYLFLHLIMVAILFYLAFRAYKIKPSITNLMMLDVNGIVLKRPLIISGICTVIFFALGIYSTLSLVGLQAAFFSFLPTGLAHDLMNAGYLFGVIALTLFLYPFISKKQEKEN